MPETKRPLKVFLCHASADKPAVRNLHRFLFLRGVSPWLDELDLLPGQDWRVEIPNALLASDVIVVCLSKNSINKEGYVQSEIAYALEKAKEKPEETIFIVPARLEDCEVPARLSQYHWVDLFREGGHNRLMMSLNQRAAQLGAGIVPAKVTTDSLLDSRQSTTRQEIRKLEREKKAEKQASEEKTSRKPSAKLKPDKMIFIVLLLLLIVFAAWSSNYLRASRGIHPMAQSRSTNTGAPQSVINPLPLNGITVNIMNPEVIDAVIQVSESSETDSLEDDNKLLLASCSSGQVIRISAPGYETATIPCDGRSEYDVWLTKIVYAYDLVLPSGHTPPDPQGNSQPDLSGVPEDYREQYLSQMENPQLPSPSPQQAIRIEIPTIDVNAPIVQGDGWEQLKKGVGQRIGSVNPGEFGNVVLSAHNDIYDELFRRLDQMKEGDKIILHTQEEIFTYSVTSTQEVEPIAVQFMASTRGHTLTLITAYPYLVDTKRFIVQAALQSDIPLPDPLGIRIGIVAGHLGQDMGAVCNNGVAEVDINQRIAAIVQQQLLELGFDVDLLKEFDPLLTDYKADALISIHNDSCEYINDQATGFKVSSFDHNKESEENLKLCLINRYKSTTGLAFHPGSTTADMTEYHTFREVNTSTPVVIIETGFLYLDYQKLTEETDSIAQGIVNSIVCLGFANK